MAGTVADTFIVSLRGIRTRRVELFRRSSTLKG